MARADGSRHSAMCPRVLYRLPDLLNAPPERPVFVVEGEKDVETLASLGLIATTNAMGAGKWRPEYNEALKGATSTSCLTMTSRAASTRRPWRRPWSALPRPSWSFSSLDCRPRAMCRTGWQSKATTRLPSCAWRQMRRRPRRQKPSKPRLRSRRPRSSRCRSRSTSRISATRNGSSRGMARIFDFAIPLSDGSYGTA